MVAIRGHAAFSMDRPCSNQSERQKNTTVAIFFFVCESESVVDVFTERA